MPRFHCAAPLASGQTLALPPGPARHVQVLRLQPGDRITLFNGEGGEFEALIAHMGRSDVDVQVGAHRALEREARREVHLAVGMPANERMDWLVEKATELGAASIQPLLAERSVLKPKGERAARKQAHWQAVAVAACEQCGRNRVPRVHAPVDVAAWLGTLPGWAVPPPATDGARTERWMLSLAREAQRLPQPADGARALILLSGPEGGLTPTEEAAARAVGFLPVTLGERVLRAETAPLAALGRWAE
jgi:16S rRNA (uracil1498-N3)-methyltransferase